MKLSLFLDVTEKQTDWPRSSFQNPPPCKQHVPHVHLGCFFFSSFFQIFGVNVCVCLCVCERLSVSVHACKCLSVLLVKTEAVPGCPAYTQTILSLNHLTVPSTIHCPEHVFHLMCILLKWDSHRGRGDWKQECQVIGKRKHQHWISE